MLIKIEKIVFLQLSTVNNTNQSQNTKLSDDQNPPGSCYSRWKQQMKPENLRPNCEELRSGPNEGVQGMRKEHGKLRLPPPPTPQGEFTGHSTPVPMASLIISDCKISDGKDCVFYLYTFVSTKISITTLYISQVHKMLVGLMLN